VWWYGDCVWDIKGDSRCSFYRAETRTRDSRAVTIPVILWCLFQIRDYSVSSEDGWEAWLQGVEPSTPQLRGLQEPRRHYHWWPAERRVYRGNTVFRGCRAVCISMYGSASVHILFKQILWHLMHKLLLQLVRLTETDRHPLHSSLFLKSVIFWDMTPCSPLSFNFATSLLAGLLNLFLRPWIWRRYVPPKRRLKLNGLHGVISQKIILFITTAVKTSNPTFPLLVLFNDASSSSDYMASIVTMINEKWIGKDMEGSGCGLNRGSNSAFAWKDWGISHFISLSPSIRTDRCSQRHLGIRKALKTKR
jgi:hypothetical protein